MIPASSTPRGAGPSSRRSNQPCSMSRARFTPVAAPLNPAAWMRLTGMTQSVKSMPSPKRLAAWPKTPLMPIRKIAGARIPGIAPPGTRRISLSALNASARIDAEVHRERHASRSLPRSASTASPMNSALVAGRHREALEDDRRVDGLDDRVAHPLGDVAQRVVLGDPAGGRVEQAAREERRADEEDHEDEREDALDDARVLRRERERLADRAEADPGGDPDQVDQQRGRRSRRRSRRRRPARSRGTT